MEKMPKNTLINYKNRLFQKYIVKMNIYMYKISLFRVILAFKYLVKIIKFYGKIMRMKMVCLIIF